jgi:hypothetical protein
MATYVYAVKDPTYLYGDHGGEDPHKNYRVAPGTRLEVKRTISGYYEVEKPTTGIVFTYPAPYDWSWVAMADVSTSPPVTPPPPAPGGSVTDEQAAAALVIVLRWFRGA